MADDQTGSRREEAPMSSSTFEDITYEVDGHKATITLNRPDALNALSPHMITELRTAYDEAENDDNIWIIIVTGTGRAFCTGADVEGDSRRRQGDQRAAVPVDLRPVGGTAGGHAAVSPDGQTGAGRHQRNLLWRRAGLGHHRRHRHRLRQGDVLRSRTSASAWWPVARWSGWPGCCPATSRCECR